MLATESVLALSGIKHKNIKGPVFSRHSGTAQIHVCPPSQWYFCSNRTLFSFWPHLVILAPFPDSFFKAAAMEVVVVVVVLVVGGGLAGWQSSVYFACISFLSQTEDVWLSMGCSNNNRQKVKNVTGLHNSIPQHVVCDIVVKWWACFGSSSESARVNDAACIIKLRYYPKPEGLWWSC